MKKSTCPFSGKNAYDTESEAKGAIERKKLFNENSFQNDLVLSVYQCNFCFKWHLTSKKRKNKKK